MKDTIDLNDQHSEIYLGVSKDTICITLYKLKKDTCASTEKVSTVLSYLLYLTSYGTTCKNPTCKPLHHPRYPINW